MSALKFMSGLVEMSTCMRYLATRALAKPCVFREYEVYSLKHIRPQM